MTVTTRLFNMRPTIFNNLRTYIQQLESSIKSNEWDIFDPNCKRIELKDSNLNSIINSGLGRKHIINPNETTIHYIKYNLDKDYILREHHDGCKHTIILYLNKDNTISDEFYVDNKLIENSNWEYNGFIMDGCLKHKGVFRGIGNRNILCIFIK